MQRCTEAGLKVGTSHSSQVPAYKTHPNTMSLEGSDLIAGPGLCHCAHTAQSQLSSLWQTRYRFWAGACITQASFCQAPQDLSLWDGCAIPASSSPWFLLPDPPHAAAPMYFQPRTPPHVLPMGALIPPKPGCIKVPCCL